MPLSEERALELAQIVPPPSIERIVRFLADLTMRSSFASPAIETGQAEEMPVGHAGLAAMEMGQSIAGRVEGASGNPILDRLIGMMRPYQIGVYELREFTMWLVKWNDKRAETEVIHDPRQYMAELRRRRAEARLAALEAEETAGADGARPHTLTRVAAAGLPVELGVEGIRRGRLIRLTPRLPEPPGPPVEPDVLSRAWREGRREMLPVEIEGPDEFLSTGSRVRPRRRLPVHRAEPAAEAVEQPIETVSQAETNRTRTAALAPPAVPRALTRALWATNLASASAMAGFLASSRDGQSLATQVASAGTTPMGGPWGAYTMGAGYQGSYPLYRPPIPPVAWMGQAASAPGVATPVGWPAPAGLAPYPTMPVPGPGIPPVLGVPVPPGAQPMPPGGMPIPPGGAVGPFGTPDRFAPSGAVVAPGSGSVAPAPYGLSSSRGGPVAETPAELLARSGIQPPMDLALPTRPGAVGLPGGPGVAARYDLFGPSSATLPPSATGAGAQGAMPPRFTPQMGAVTLLAPALLVASAQAERHGTAVAFDWKNLARRAGSVTPAGLADLRRVLPPGSQVIYPALPEASLGPNAVNLPLAPTLLGPMLEQSYGPQASPYADHFARLARSYAGGTPAIAPMPGRIVPTLPPAGAQAGVLGGAAAGPAGALAEAGGGMSRRGQVLDFLGVPVRLAPSLGGRAELRDEMAVRGALPGVSPTTVRPEVFGPVRERLFPAMQSVQAEPDRTAWQKAAPAFGMRNAEPATVLAPDSRLKPLSPGAPVPSIGTTSAPVLHAAAGTPQTPATLAATPLGFAGGPGGVSGSGAGLEPLARMGLSPASHPPLPGPLSAPPAYAPGPVAAPLPLPGPLPMPGVGMPAPATLRANLPPPSSLLAAAPAGPLGLSGGLPGTPAMAPLSVPALSPAPHAALPGLPRTPDSLLLGAQVPQTMLPGLLPFPGHRIPGTPTMHPMRRPRAVPALGAGLPGALGVLAAVLPGPPPVPGVSLPGEGRTSIGGTAAALPGVGATTPSIPAFTGSGMGRPAAVGAAAIVGGAAMPRALPSAGTRVGTGTTTPPLARRAAPAWTPPAARPMRTLALSAPHIGPRGPAAHTGTSLPAATPTAPMRLQSLGPVRALATTPTHIGTSLPLAAPGLAAGPHTAPASLALPSIPAPPAMRVSTIATQAPTMALPPVAAARPTIQPPMAIQRASADVAAASAQVQRPQDRLKDSVLSMRQGGAAANEVYVLANEVWSILRRRLASEADRRGRW